MKTIISSSNSLLAFLLFAFWGQISCNAQQPVCDSSLWNHVYSSYRLTVNSECVYATGYVQYIYATDDGDYHIEIKLDSAFTFMLDTGNINSTNGNLICEIICANQIFYSDVVPFCQNYISTVFVPNVNEHVKITGSFVTDHAHGLWNEIHPITKIEIISLTGLQSTESNNISMKMFPTPASSNVNFELIAPPATPVFITITDGSGRLAGQYQMKDNPKFAVNTSYFPDGIYYYSAVMDDKLIKSGKFIVAH